MAMKNGRMGIFAFCAPEIYECLGTIENCNLALRFQQFFVAYKTLGEGQYLCISACTGALPVALLFVYWFLHMVCGISSPILGHGDLDSDADHRISNTTVLGDTAFAKQALPMVCMLVFVWICMYTIFSVFPADLPIFIDTIS